MEQMLQRLEVTLEALRRQVERLEERLAPEPTCLTYPEAARRLGVGLTKFKQMVRSGQIHTTRIGKVPMVARQELERIASHEAERSAVSRRGRAAAWRAISKRR